MKPTPIQAVGAQQIYDVLGQDCTNAGWSNDSTLQTHGPKEPVSAAAQVQAPEWKLRRARGST